jgi:hypothetical protein
MSRDVQSCTHWLRPRNPPITPHLDSYTVLGSLSQKRQTISLRNPLSRTFLLSLLGIRIAFDVNKAPIFLVDIFKNFNTRIRIRVRNTDPDLTTHMNRKPESATLLVSILLFAELRIWSRIYFFRIRIHPVKVLNRILNYI